MFAASAVSFSPDHPLTGLRLGEHPEPEAPDGWTVIEVRATSINHHDLWTLRGVGITEDRLPMILGCDAAGVDPEGNEVIVHSVITGAATPTRPWTPGARCSARSTREPSPSGWLFPGATSSRSPPR